jgi:hypothetical protein
MAHSRCVPSIASPRCCGPNAALDAADLRAEAAAVSAIAGGSDHRTTRAMRHRIARSLSVSAERGTPSSR